VSIGCGDKGELVMEVKDDNPGSGKDIELRKPRTAECGSPTSFWCG
jgi:hypothetical protein